MRGFEDSVPDEGARLQWESAARLEKMHDDDRERARQRMRADPEALTDYERRLLGREYRDFVRRRDADRQAAQEAAQSAARYRDTVTRSLRPAGIQFRNDLLPRLNQHAIDLAVRHGLTVQRSTNSGGWAVQETRTISVPPVVSEETYAVALHEIGHVVSPDADSRQYRNFVEGDALHSLDGELGAWRWAYKHAMVWTLEMQERLYRSLVANPAFRAATDDERWRMGALLTSACLRIEGPTWTFVQLENARAAVRGRT